MKLRHSLVACAVSALAAPVGTPAADSFRCRSSIIDTGMIAPEVIAKCGEPNSREIVAEPIRARLPNGGTIVVGTATREHWIYERGWGQFHAQLTFEEGHLKKIELLDRK